MFGGDRAVRSTISELLQPRHRSRTIAHGRDHHDAIRVDPALVGDQFGQENASAVKLHPIFKPDVFLSLFFYLLGRAPHILGDLAPRFRILNSTLRFGPAMGEIRPESGNSLSDVRTTRFARPADWVRFSLR